jgi:hypothetical protein
MNFSLLSPSNSITFYFGGPNTFKNPPWGEWEINFALENYDFPMQVACYAEERVLWVIL